MQHKLQRKCSGKEIGVGEEVKCSKGAEEARVGLRFLQEQRRKEDGCRINIIK
jgi:hypothetical protein